MQRLFRIKSIEHHFQVTISRLTSSSHRGGLTLLACLMVFGIAFSEGNPPAFPDDKGCTMAMVRAGRTADGRMLIWKNRDVSNRNQVIRLMQGPVYRFTGIGYGDDTTQVWGGVNTAGFAVANTNMWQSDSFQHPDDDGIIMTQALGSYNTIAQFRALMVTTNTTRHNPPQENGRNTPSDFFVFDSSGAMSIFEASRDTFVEWRLTDTVRNCLFTRANYAYYRDSTYHSASNPLGYYRNNRAYRFYNNTLNAGQLPLDTVFRVMRDVAPEGWAPNVFPLPYDGRIGNYPYAYASMQGSICRYNTTSAMVIEGGKQLPDRPYYPPVIWFCLGPPMTTISVPVWPHQSHLSPLLTGTSAPICTEANAIYNAIAGTNYCLDTRPLVNSNGGLFPYIINREKVVKKRTLPYLNIPLSPDLAAAFSDSMAQYVYSSLTSFAPPTAPSGFNFDVNARAFTWQPVSRDFRGRMLPTGTTVQYQIERATPTHAPWSLHFTPVGTVTTNWYSVNLDNGLTYIYRIKAVGN